MCIEQIIEFELREAGPPGRTCTLKLVIFMTKQNFLKEGLLVDYYLLLKYCRRQCILLPPTCVKSLIKFNTKMQDFKRVLDLNCKQMEY